GPDAVVSCGRRSITTVAPQALALLNDRFIRDRAADLARRLLAERGADVEGWIDRGFWLALARPPGDAERAAGVPVLEPQRARRTEREPSQTVEAIRQDALTDFCQALFSLNEFIYVD